MWTPKEHQGEAPAPLRRIEIDGVGLLSHSKGETEEELRDQGRFNCVNMRRAGVNNVEGMKKLKEAKTQDNRVEIMREYGAKDEEVDCTKHLKIECEKVSIADSDGEIIEVKVTIKGKEGRDMYEVDKELQLMKVILKRLQTEHPGWKNSRVREERLISPEVKSKFMEECMNA